MGKQNLHFEQRHLPVMRDEQALCQLLWLDHKCLI